MGILPVGGHGNPASHTQALPQAACGRRGRGSAHGEGLSHGHVCVFYRGPNFPYSNKVFQSAVHPWGQQTAGQIRPRSVFAHKILLQHSTDIYLHIICGSSVLRQPSPVLLQETTCGPSQTYLLPDHVLGYNYPPGSPHPSPYPILP